MGESIALGEVQETLLIPLYGRALDAAQSRSVLNDRRAIEFVDAIDYDFTKFRGPSLAGSVLRASIFDGYVRTFLDRHPDGTVVDLGCGLSTRFDRLDNGRLRWFDLDVPDTMALRRRFFGERERYTMIAGSLFDADWIAEVTRQSGPTFILSEAVLLYFDADRVRCAIEMIAKAFPGQHLSFDTGGKAMMNNQDRNPVFKAVPARMQWICDDPREVEPAGVTLVESRTFATPQPDVGQGWPAKYRYGLKALRVLIPPTVTSYKLNRYEIAAS